MRSAWVLLLASACAPAEPRLSLVHAPVQALRPDNPASTDLFRYDAGDNVEGFASAGGDFRIHFTRAGAHAVPLADGNGDGTPDYVETAAAVYDEVLVYYTAVLGYRAPLSDANIGDNGGDARFDVYLIDFGGAADGAFRLDACWTTNADQCVGYMLQENDFAGYGYPSLLIAARVLASHELFHAVQAAYDSNQGSVLSEGTAVWASEAFDPTLDDLEWFVDGYLASPDRSLDRPMPGPVDPFSYGSALFWQFVGERYDPDLVRAVWEACENGAGGVADPYWLEILGGVLLGGGANFADAFTEFARWNLYTGSRANPAVAYAAGGAYPRVRIDTKAAPYSDDALRLFYASTQYYGLAPAGRASMTAALVGEPAHVSGVRLFLAVDAGGSYAEVVEGELAGGTVVSTSAASQLVVAVINTATSGDSKKPALCIGSPVEVEDCVQAYTPSDDPSGSGGGCLAATPGVSGSVLAALLVLALARRRFSR